MGAALGWIFDTVPNRNKTVAERNIALCYPQLDPAARRKLTRQNLLETGKNITELSAFWHWKKEKILKIHADTVGRDLYDAAQQQGKGVIVASPHFGAWELAGLLLSIEAPIHFLYRPNRNSAIDEPVISARERFGGACHPITSKGLGKLVRALKKAETIAILPDQEPARDHGVFAPLYGVPAYTMTFLANLAKRTGAPVIFTAAERLPKGQGFRIHYLKAEDDLYDDNPEIAAAALNHSVERCIDIAAAQYMWNYKRFRKRPPGTPSLYS